MYQPTILPAGMSVSLYHRLHHRMAGAAVEAGEAAVGPMAELVGEPVAAPSAGAAVVRSAAPLAAGAAAARVAAPSATVLEVAAVPAMVVVCHAARWLLLACPAMPHHRRRRVEHPRRQRVGHPCRRHPHHRHRRFRSMSKGRPRGSVRSSACPM